MVYPKGGPLAEKDRRIAELEAQLAEAVRLLHTTDRSAEHEWLDAYDALLRALADKGGE